jgi:hypothetical protein
MGVVRCIGEGGSGGFTHRDVRCGTYRGDRGGAPLRGRLGLPPGGFNTPGFAGWRALGPARLPYVPPEGGGAVVTVTVNVTVT